MNHPKPYTYCSQATPGSRRNWKRTDLTARGDPVGQLFFVHRNCSGRKLTNSSTVIIQI